MPFNGLKTAVRQAKESLVGSDLFYKIEADGSCKFMIQGILPYAFFYERYIKTVPVIAYQYDPA